MNHSCLSVGFQVFSDVHSDALNHASVYEAVSSAFEVDLIEMATRLSSVILMKTAAYTAANLLQCWISRNSCRLACTQLS